MQDSDVVKLGIDFCKKRVDDFEKQCKKDMHMAGSSVGLTPKKFDEGTGIIMRILVLDYYHNYISIQVAALATLALLLSAIGDAKC